MAEWKCPCCVNGTVTSETEAQLEIAISNHIQRHEDVAALRAVDAARLCCQNMNCAIGMEKKWDFKNSCWMYKLSDFDIRFLRGLRIAQE